MYLHKTYIDFIYIYPSSRIYNNSLTSAYFGLDNRECGHLKYLFIYEYRFDVLRGNNTIEKF
jgi:hypothetical protein